MICYASVLIFCVMNSLLRTKNGNYNRHQNDKCSQHLFSFCLLVCYLEWLMHCGCGMYDNTVSVTILNCVLKLPQSVSIGKLCSYWLSYLWCSKSSLAGVQLHCRFWGSTQTFHLYQRNVSVCCYLLNWTHTLYSKSQWRLGQTFWYKTIFWV